MSYKSHQAHRIRRANARRKRRRNQSIDRMLRDLRAPDHEMTSGFANRWGGDLPTATTTGSAVTQ
jgi:hypothetical protein